MLRIGRPRVVGALVLPCGLLAACSSEETAPTAGNGVGGSEQGVGASAGAGAAGGEAGSAGAAGQAGAAGSASVPEVLPPLDLGLPEPVTGSFTDVRDGKSYAWVEFNTARWMAENLVFQLPPGDIQTCYYDSLLGQQNCELHGYFYGWSALHGQARVAGLLDVDLPEATYRGICPEGWRIPTKDEWVDLIDAIAALAGPEVAGGYDVLGMLRWTGITAPFKSSEGWGVAGTNELGFNIEPRAENGNEQTSFWASDESGRSAGWVVEFSEDSIRVETDLKAFRHAIRCVLGEPSGTFPVIAFPAPGNDVDVFTDPRDQTVYHFTQIGEQRWLSENLKYQPESGVANCYANQADHCRLFGRLYGFETAQTACPAGWHLPSVAEWHTLGDFIDAETGPLGKEETEDTAQWQIGEHLISNIVWRSGSGELPAFGFHALPGGSQIDADASGSLGDEAKFWTMGTNARGSQILVTVSAAALTIAPVINGVEASVRCVSD
jgi:uncharacterized protein (TIGR02145 family)